jgi:hypothetical protein
VRGTEQDITKTSPAAAFLVDFVLGAFFCSLGVTMLKTPWHGIPWVLRLGGGLIGFACLAVGLIMVFGSLVRQILQNRDARDARAQITEDASLNSGYACPNCGATLANGAEVSPLGDAKCGYCQQWFNVFGRDGKTSAS